jgi:hypothetical protein
VGASDADDPLGGFSEVGRLVRACEIGMALPGARIVGASDEADETFVAVVPLLSAETTVGLSEAGVFGTLGSLIPTENPGKAGTSYRFSPVY